MERVWHLLPRTLQRYGLTDEARAALVVRTCQLWLAKHAPTAGRLLDVGACRDGVLELRATHSIGLQEGAALVPQLLAALHAHPDTRWVADIRLVRA